MEVMLWMDKSGSEPSFISRAKEEKCRYEK
jgi:hypothetical protein